ncbi:MAG: hypothetical protein AB1758_15320 [Candidatus Eremiobacterota bacterium]
MWRTFRNQGASIIELLVYAAVFLLMLGMVYASLLLALNYYHGTRNFSALQQNVLVAAGELSEELARAPSDRVSTQTDAIVFLSPTRPQGGVAYDGTGHLYWQKWVCYYRDPQNQLRRKELPITPVVDPPSPVPAAATLIGDANLPSRLVAPEITAFTFGAPPGQFVTITASNTERGGAGITVTTGTTFRP